MFGVYQEEASLIFERSESFLPPWRQEEYVFVRDVLEKETSRSASLLGQLLRRLEDRSASWGDRCEDDDDDLTEIASSRDPLLGATGSIGFSFFGLGWNVSVSTSVYRSRLERWRRRTARSWPLASKVARWRPLFDAIADDDGLLSGKALVEATRNELKEEVRGGDLKDLRDAWNLADARGDGALDFDEFLLFVHLVNDWAKPLPPSLPSHYVPPSARTKNRRKTTLTTGLSGSPAAAAAGAETGVLSDGEQTTTTNSGDGEIARRDLAESDDADQPDGDEGVEGEGEEGSFEV